MGTIEEWGLKKKEEERLKKGGEKTEEEKLNVFDKLLVIHGGNVETVMAYLHDEVIQAKRRYELKHGGPSIADQLIKEAEEHAEDDLGRVLYLKKHFDEVPEPERSMIWEKLWELQSTFSKEAQTEISMLALHCEAGKQLLQKRTKEAAEKFPEHRSWLTGKKG